MLPIDPHADKARRAWLPCPKCRDHENCENCLSGETCRVHWRYLLANAGHVVHLQCPNCTHLWVQNTAA